ncbi:YetF domain-containing protein, partial [Salmonella enterica]|uniref:YetF domain-containing protein n=1 Tax=Salmonella enterica TaxID=28901 RepID=UPI00398C2CD8
ALGGKSISCCEEREMGRGKLQRANMKEFEFFMGFRLNGVEQLGQIRLAILGTNGQISVYFFDNKDVKPGLSILPEHCTTRFIGAPEAGDYARVRCREVTRMNPGETQVCPRVSNPEWTKASRAKRGV